MPQVIAYWLMSPWIAAHAASFIGSGIGKSGKPCARLIAPCWLRDARHLADDGFGERRRSRRASMMRACGRSRDPCTQSAARRRSATRSPLPPIFASAARISSGADIPSRRLIEHRCAPPSRRRLSCSRATRARGSRPRRRAAAAAAPRRRRRRLQLVELVGEIENQLLRLLPPDARHALQRRDVLLADRPHQALRRKRRQQAERERRPDALCAQHALEHAPLERRREAEELPAVLPHDEVRVQRDRLARPSAASRTRRAESRARSRRRRPS